MPLNLFLNITNKMASATAAECVEDSDGCNSPFQQEGNSEQGDANTENENDSYEESDSGQSTQSTAKATVPMRKKSNDGYTRRKRKRQRAKSSLHSGIVVTNKLFKCTNFIKEDHRQPLFGAQFYHGFGEQEADYSLFATAGSNILSVYRCEDKGFIRLLQCYADSDPEENFYACAWTTNIETGNPLVAFAGAKGIIHILNPVSRQCNKSYQAHGSAVNELKFHPMQPSILLSTSKDHAIRMWNIRTDVCIAIFGGIDGHRDEVLSIDFDILGEKILSAGMDHALKIWSLKEENVQNVINKSFTYDSSTESVSFPTLCVHYPHFSTRDIHRNYVDCVRWIGDLILSKSCDNRVVCWKTTQAIDNVLIKKHSNENGVLVLHRFEISNCDIWFIRFALDHSQKYLAVGNQIGKIFVWDLDVDHPSDAKCYTLSFPKCTTTVRQVCFNRDSTILLAVCDDGTVWRWDRINSNQ